MKLYRVSLEANYVDFVAYVEATGRDDAYKKGYHHQCARYSESIDEVLEVTEV